MIRIQRCLLHLGLPLKYFRVGVSAVIFNNLHDPSKILMIQRENEPYKDKLCFPGGKVEQGEHYLEATIREVKEETGGPYINLGLDVFTMDHHLFKVTYMKEYLIITSVCYIIGDGKIPKHDDHLKPKWFTFKEIEEKDDKEFVPNIRDLSINAFNNWKRFL